MTPHIIVLLMREAVHQIEPLVEDIKESSLTAMKEDTQVTITAASTRKTIAMGIGLATVIIGLVMAFMISRSITKPINNVIEGLSSGAEQVASASNQVSSSSQQLAGGASEKASSLEETSSFLEEVSTMSRQNAENANQAKTMMVADSAKSTANLIENTINTVKKGIEITTSTQEAFKENAEISLKIGN